MKTLNVIFILLCLGTTQTSMAANPSPYQGPDFVATQKTAEQGNESSQGKVYFSKAGNRIEFGSTIAGADFVKGKCWFASTGQKIYVEGNIDKNTGDCDADLSMGAPRGEATVGGLMSSQACEGFSVKKKLESKKQAGRTIEKWGCRDNRSDEAIHWYDAKLKLVVREKTRYAQDELINIKFKKLNISLFSSPKGYKRVNKNQFMQTLMSGAMK